MNIRCACRVSRLISLRTGLVAGVVLCASASHASPWATRVVSYDPGEAVGSPYSDPDSALGKPTRFTGIGVFPGAVTPFNPAFSEGDIVSIGRGGHLTLELGRPARDDPRNPFGIDLLVFGNAGFIDLDYPNGLAGRLFGGSRGGTIEVSANGLAWEPIIGVEPDGGSPTLGYLDLDGPYSTSRGRVRSEFTRPVNPSFDPSGRSFAEIVAGYDGSGGGMPIDIADTGLSRVSFIRFTMPMSAVGTAEIDAVAVVRAIPAPGAFIVVAAGAWLGARRQLRRRDRCE